MRTVLIHAGAVNSLIQPTHKVSLYVHHDLRKAQSTDEGRITSVDVLLYHVADPIGSAIRLNVYP
jgi:hypothetical protein